VTERFDGTAARQLALLEEIEKDARPVSIPRARRVAPAARNLRLLQKDIYAELTRRRRRAQIAARRFLGA
jgi:hypothetical protein